MKQGEKVPSAQGQKAPTPAAPRLGAAPRAPGAQIDPESTLRRAAALSAPGAPYPDYLRGLESASGYRAVDRLRARPGNDRPLQLARLNLRPNGTISGVSSFPPRPTSNLRGTQGQHLTAYVVFEDMILSRVKDRTPAGAAQELIAVLDEILALPGMQLQSGAYLLPYIQRCKDLLTADSANTGDVIDEILSIRNKVPGTAERGIGGGHGEAGHSGVLELVESALRTDSWKDSWDEDRVSEQCRYYVWRLLDYDPPNPASAPDRQVIANVILTHYKSIISAYPKVDEWLNSRHDSFQGYLEAHRDDAGVPLHKVSPAQLTLIFDLVSQGL